MLVHLGVLLGVCSFLCVGRVDVWICVDSCFILTGYPYSTVILVEESAQGLADLFT